MLGILMLLKRRYRWIDAFYATPTAPGHYRIVFTATPEHEADRDYTPVSVAEVRELLPSGGRVGTKRQRALEFINRLPPEERRFLVDRLRTLPKEESARLFSEIGDLADNVADPDALAAGLRRRRTGEVVDDVTPIEASLREDAPHLFDEAAEGARVEQRVTYRVNAETIQTSRAALKRRMAEPDWANGVSKNWNPHHVIPVEAQNHWVFDVLRGTKEGWDHNAALNGIALPTNLKLAREVGLPVHQYGADVLLGLDKSALRDLRGHPVWNEMVKRRLDRLEAFRGDPAALRSKVLALVDDLKGTIEASGWTVLR